MNTTVLHQLIDRYEESIDTIYNDDHDELFKWKAMKTWREEWFKPDSAFTSFSERFTAAKRDFSLFIDNARMHPSAGVIKLWEKEPEEVERLFNKVLFADPHGDATTVQDNMDEFLDGYEALRQKHFPRNWSYKQDRHSASVYLAMNDPEFNFVYKSNEALEMAKYIEFGFSIGSGMSFKLPNYYQMCEEIVAALKEHESLLKRHFARLTPEYYNDQSLHLLAFDLMYCCRTYNFYRGLALPSSDTKKQKNNPSMPTQEEVAQREAERLAKIDLLEQQISEQERICDDFEDISLIGVQVATNLHGVGTVIAQEKNIIIVRFQDTEKKYVLDSRYPARPRFEDDEEIVSAFTEYGRAQNELKRLQRELALLQK